MYVEPTVFLPSRGEILLAGTPNYLYSPGGPVDARAIVQDSVFGAIIDAKGVARLVPAPIDPTRITRVRGVVRADGVWAVAFAELKHPTTPPEPDTVVRFWYGEFDGKRWTKIEPLPVPAGDLLTAGSSNLLVRGDSAFLAIPRRTPAGSYDVALFERGGGRWSVSFPTVRGVAYAFLTFAGTGDLMMGIVRAGTAVGRDENSVFVQTRRSVWSPALKILQGYPEPIHQPRVATSRDGPVLTWQAFLPTGRRIARALVGALDPSTHVITLDTAVRLVHPVLGLFASPLWVTEHVGAPMGSEIRFYGRAPRDAARLVGSLRNPYTGPFATFATDPHDLLLAGPLLRAEPPNPSLVTLFIRARVECAARAP